MNKRIFFSCAEAIFTCAPLGNKKGINSRGGFK
jgi:hypothetical protein